MHITRPSARAAWLLAAALPVASLVAQAADVFDFIPAGGRTLLAKVLGSRPPASEVSALVSAKRTREEWLGYLRGQRKTITGLQLLKEKELITLADYMSFNLPLSAAKVPSNPTQANWEKQLPLDGRDLALEYCQGCHIITVVITQDRTKDAWVGSMNKPAHVQIALSRAQREALASYLVLNAAIPIDLVPEDLRAGGATY
jgi:mono/diheme cytochrome c family protein